MRFLNTTKFLAAFSMLVLLSACGEHNTPAPNEGKNHDSEYIYGNKGGEPMQLPNQYEDPEGINDRSKAIYNKMYAPKMVNSISKDAAVATQVTETVVTDSTATN